MAKTSGYDSLSFVYFFFTPISLLWWACFGELERELEHSHVQNTPWPGGQHTAMRAVIWGSPRREELVTGSLPFTIWLVWWLGFCEGPTGCCFFCPWESNGFSQSWVDREAHLPSTVCSPLPGPLWQVERCAGLLVCSQGRWVSTWAGLRHCPGNLGLPRPLP